MLITETKKFQMTPKEKIIADKLAYEWKNIYRNLLNMDWQENFTVDIKDFEQLCHRFKVLLTSDDLKRIYKLFSINNYLLKSTGDLQGTMTPQDD